MYAQHRKTVLKETKNLWNKYCQGNKIRLSVVVSKQLYEAKLNKNLKLTYIDKNNNLLISTWVSNSRLNFQRLGNKRIKQNGF